MYIDIQPVIHVIFDHPEAPKEFREYIFDSMRTVDFFRLQVQAAFEINRNHPDSKIFAIKQLRAAVSSLNKTADGHIECLGKQHPGTPELNLRTATVLVEQGWPTS